MPTTVFVAGSIWVTRLPPSQLVIQIAVVPAARPPHGEAGFGIGIVASIAFVASLIRTTALLFGTPVQMLPNPRASQFGPDGPVGPTEMFAVMPAFRSVYEDIAYDYADIVNTNVTDPYVSSPDNSMPLETLRDFCLNHDLLAPYIRHTIPVTAARPARRAA